MVMRVQLQEHTTVVRGKYVLEILLIRQGFCQPSAESEEHNFYAPSNTGLRLADDHAGRRLRRFHIRLNEAFVRKAQIGRCSERNPATKITVRSMRKHWIYSTNIYQL